jgi:hypothetical protein
MKTETEKGMTLAETKTESRLVSTRPVGRFIHDPTLSRQRVPKPRRRFAVHHDVNGGKIARVHCIRAVGFIDWLDASA